MSRTAYEASSIQEFDSAFDRLDHVVSTDVKYAVDLYIQRTVAWHSGTLSSTVFPCGFRGEPSASPRVSITTFTTSDCGGAKVWVSVPVR